MKRYGLPIALSAALVVGALSGCTTTSQASASEPRNAQSSVASVIQSNTASAETEMPSESSTAPEADSLSSESASTTSSSSQTGSLGTLVDSSDQFSDRDLEQTADTSGATTLTVIDGQDLQITEEGVYVISGDAENCTITVTADDNAKVQLVLDNVSITNESAPAIYVTSADKVFVTTASGSQNTLTVTGDFAQTTDDNITGVIFSKDDIVFNGQGTLTISSTANGIVGKDDVKFTGGTYAITAGNHAIKANDSVRIADGTFTLAATKDGIHAENEDDQTLGYVYVAGGTFTIDAQSDGIEGDAFVVIDGGTLSIDAEEGIEGTNVQVNDGTIEINASDDGINASQKSTAYSPVIEINGGKVAITMAQGDTDALDSNGALYINGGEVDITAQFAFDFVTEAKLTGGTVTVNGEQVTEITESMQMGGPGMGGMGGPGGQRPDMGDMSSQGTPPNMSQGGGPGGMGGHGHGPHGDAGAQMGSGNAANAGSAGA